MARKIGGVDQSRRASKPKQKRRSNRSLQLKIRVIPTVRMPKSVMLSKLMNAINTGIVPEDLQVSWLEWDHAKGRRFSPGDRIPGDALDEMQHFYGVLSASAMSGTIRLERPDT